MSYAKMQSYFRLRIIESEADYEQANAAWQRYREAIAGDRHIQEDTADYLEILTMLMGKYEDDKLKAEFPDDAGGEDE